MKGNLCMQQTSAFCILCPNKAGAEHRSSPGPPGAVLAGLAGGCALLWAFRAWPGALGSPERLCWAIDALMLLLGKRFPSSVPGGNKAKWELAAVGTLRSCLCGEPSVWHKLRPGGWGRAEPCCPGAEQGQRSGLAPSCMPWSLALLCWGPMGARIIAQPVFLHHPPVLCGVH